MLNFINSTVVIAALALTASACTKSRQQVEVKPRTNTTGKTDGAGASEPAGNAGDASKPADKAGDAGASEPADKAGDASKPADKAGDAGASEPASEDTKVQTTIDFNETTNLDYASLSYEFSYLDAKKSGPISVGADKKSTLLIEGLTAKKESVMKLTILEKGVAKYSGTKTITLSVGNNSFNFPVNPIAGSGTGDDKANANLDVKFKDQDAGSSGSAGGTTGGTAGASGLTIDWDGKSNKDSGKWKIEDVK